MTADKRRQTLNHLNESPSDQAFLESDAAPVLSLYPDGEPVSKKQATHPRQQANTPAENSSALEAIFPPFTEPVPSALLLYDEAVNQIFHESSFVTSINVDALV